MNVFQFEPVYMFQMTLRLLLAVVLGGVIGFEREFSSHKPAGFRTHILVSVGSAMVMMTSDFVLRAYPTMNIDPTRIGAQVVSGIGFLGAGAILRHGFSVKGLTTAASLWAVACVGLACGIGFFFGAALGTLLIWGVLLYLKSLEAHHQSKGAYIELSIEAETFHALAGEVSRIVVEEGATLREIHLVTQEFGTKQLVKCAFQLTQDKIGAGAGPIVAKLQTIPGVTRVFQ